MGQALVKTNQRSLIVKVLARYATDFFSLKELVQNADDAGATHVQIRLTRSATPGTGTFSRLVVRNNGRPFQSSDWERITTIAGGNPDSASVGYFGVGFFSVFALSDGPTITSSGQRMRFGFGGADGEKLFTHSEDVPDDGSGWTAFGFDLKANTESFGFGGADGDKLFTHSEDVPDDGSGWTAFDFDLKANAESFGFGGADGEKLFTHSEDAPDDGSGWTAFGFDLKANAEACTWDLDKLHVFFLLKSLFHTSRPPPPPSRRAQACTWDLDELQVFLLKALLFPKRLALIEVLVDGATALAIRRECGQAYAVPIAAGLSKESPTKLFSLGYRVGRGVEIGDLNGRFCRECGQAYAVPIATGLPKESPTKLFSPVEPRGAASFVQSAALTLLTSAATCMFIFPYSVLNTSHNYCAEQKPRRVQCAGNITVQDLRLTLTRHATAAAAAATPAGGPSESEQQGSVDEGAAPDTTNGDNAAADSADSASADTTVSTASLALVHGALSVETKQCKPFIAGLTKKLLKAPPSAPIVSLTFDYSGGGGGGGGGGAAAAQERDDWLLSLVSPTRCGAEPCGKVFVGMDTHQTTGTGYHLNGPLWPTMERTSLDVQDKFIGGWNRDLLHCGGLVARAFYDYQFERVTRAYDAAPAALPGSGYHELFPQLDGPRRASLAAPATGSPESMSVTQLRSPASSRRSHAAAVTGSPGAAGRAKPTWASSSIAAVRTQVAALDSTAAGTGDRDPNASSTSSKKRNSASQKGKADAAEAAVGGCAQGEDAPLSDAEAVMVVILSAHASVPARPLDAIGACVRDAFWQRGNARAPPLRLLTSLGVRPMTEARQVPAALMGIDRYLGLPLVPAAIAARCAHFFAAALPAERRGSDYGKKKAGAKDAVKAAGRPVPDLTMDDIVEVLPRRVLSLAEVVDVLRWYLAWIKKSQHRTVYRPFHNSLRFDIQDLRQTTTTLAHYETHAEGQSDYVGLPLPPHTLPIALSQFFSAADLSESSLTSEGSKYTHGRISCRSCDDCDSAQQLLPTRTLPIALSQFLSAADLSESLVHTYRFRVKAVAALSDSCTRCCHSPCPSSCALLRTSDVELATGMLGLVASKVQRDRLDELHEVEIVSALAAMNCVPSETPRLLDSRAAAAALVVSANAPARKAPASGPVVLRKPSEVYMLDASAEKHFGNLPRPIKIPGILWLTCDASATLRAQVGRQFLLHIGVREVPQVSVVLKHFLGRLTTSTWEGAVRYLALQQSALTDADWSALQRSLKRIPNFNCIAYLGVPCSPFVRTYPSRRYLAPQQSALTDAD
ncbi:hypothetical protein JKP88DRAFT_241511 [Tribonema minus]|uniref:Sacsin/Nov domain-containing protein n=1 Tax=Tribonema minus TaxID=303371 RepID=A0A836CD37_9STRA|nr:hypothetical protein JKP88DRAFT_241511 [Tribonema minus]